MQAETLTAGDILLRLGLTLVLVLANGFFVAAEFSLVGARRTRIDAEAARGNRRAILARSAIRHLDHYISGTQLGITLSSLGLGWVAESTVATVLMGLFQSFPSPWDVIGTHAVAGTIAFLLITVLHIVLGELAPKSLALLFPESVSMWTAGPLILFSRALSPFIAFLNGSANLLLRMVGLRAPTESERVHRPEEIRLLVSQTHEHGLIEREPVEMLHGVLDLPGTTVGEVMTPRTDVVALPETATVTEAADQMLLEGHFRIPVYRESIDSIAGVVLARDVWRAERGGTLPITDIVRPVPFVPDSKPVHELLREMQIARLHMAVVVDEYGGTAGIVTIEDLVEEVVGEIQDEHEQELPEIEETAEGTILLDGMAPITELNERFGLGVPTDEHTTVAGFVMQRLGRIAEEGDDVEFPRGRLRVLRMKGRRIQRLALDLVPDETATALPAENPDSL